MTPFEKAARAFANSRGAEGTKELYNQDIDQWLAFCDKHNVDPSDPTLEHATDYRHDLETKISPHTNKTLAPQTIRRTLTALSRMYRAATSKHPPAASWNPFDSDALKRPPPSTFGKTKSLTDEQAQAIIAEAVKDKAFGVRDVAILQMLYTTGARISSVVNLRHEKLFYIGKTLVARVPAKKKDEVDIELSGMAASAIDKWLVVAPKSDFVFPAPKNPRIAVSRRVIYKRLVGYGKAIGILNNVHPHRFRASYITSAIDAGIPLNEIRAAVHHSSSDTTARYDRGVRGTGVAAAVAAFREKKETT